MHGAGDENVALGKPQVPDHLAQEFSRPANERPSGLCLLLARRLADEDDPRVRASLAGHRQTGAILFADAAGRYLASDAIQMTILAHEGPPLGPEISWQRIRRRRTVNIVWPGARRSRRKTELRDYRAIGMTKLP